jgi:hypothetical protein
MSRAGQRARLDKLLEAIGPKLQRIRVEGGPAGMQPGPMTCSTNAGGVRTWSSPDTDMLIKGADERAKTSPWVTSGLHKTEAERAEEEAKRLVEMLVKARAG